MLSQATSLAIAKAYSAAFTCKEKMYGCDFDPNALHDFLFARDFPFWVYDKAQFLFNDREAEEWIMHLHTGISVPDMPNATDEERQLVGRGVLVRLAESLLNWVCSSDSPRLRRYALLFRRMLDRVEFDGYKYDSDRLLAPEDEVSDTKEERGVLLHLYASLGLAKIEVAEHCLELCEDHWLSKKWDDCIGNARRFLDGVLREVAHSLSLKKSGTALPEKTYTNAEKVRQYLRAGGLLEVKEEEAVRVIYGLLSNTGNHPYIAEQDQARMLKKLALVMAQFVMLRFQGYLAANP